MNHLATLPYTLGHVARARPISALARAARLSVPAPLPGRSTMVTGSSSASQPGVHHLRHLIARHRSANPMAWHGAVLPCATERQFALGAGLPTMIGW